MLLRLVQALVERAGRVGEFLERGAALRHHVGAQGSAARPDPSDGRRWRARRTARSAAWRYRAARFPPRGQFFSCSARELEPGVKRRDARVTERGDVLRGRPPALRAIAPGRPLLRVGERSAGDRKRGRAGKNSLPHGIPPMAFQMTPIVESARRLFKLKFGQRLSARNVDLRAFSIQMRRNCRRRRCVMLDYIMPSSRGRHSDSSGPVGHHRQEHQHGQQPRPAPRS